MPEYKTGDAGREMGAVPFGEIISGIALGIAEGQWALDKASMTVSELMSGQRLLRDLDTGKLLAANGSELAAGAQPHVVDSRVYFGYDYVRVDADTTKITITTKVEEVDVPDPAGETIKESKTGIIDKIIVPSGGLGADYSFPPEVEILGAGTGAKAEATVINGKIVVITVKEGGSGYDAATTTVRLTGGGGQRVPRKLSMIELGFTPNFYQFVDTIIEIKLVVNMVQSNEESKGETPRTVTTNESSSEYNSHGWGWSWWRPHSSSYKRKETSVVTQTVDAAYANKYSYSVEGSSLVRTKLVPVPPPTILEERIRQLMDEEERYRNEQLRSGKKPS